MTTVRRVRFETLPLEERIKIATQGMSISTYANGKYAPLSAARTQEVERISRKALSEFNRSRKPQPA